MTLDPVRLTSLSHGGGCGCKIAPALLSEMLKAMPQYSADPHLLVGTASGDDAAVYQLTDELTVVATTDFFMPVVDDPYDFGRIAAANALSDVYAMGARPIMALAIVGMPVDRLPVETIQAILAGGEAQCAQAGVPIAGGHSIDSREPIYGLAVLGVAHPCHIKRNDRARPGDILILAKALGIGILSAALKKGALSLDGYREMLESATQLNSVGSELGALPGVHALTDVSGFGLLGHLLGLCRGARLAAMLDLSRLPMLPMALQLAQQGYVTGASARNWASYGRDVHLPPGLPDWQRDLLCDPQTSGGLLASCAPGDTEQVLDLFHRRGYPYARIIGQMDAGECRVFAY